jgi:hypothetical protein
LIARHERFDAGVLVHGKESGHPIIAEPAGKEDVPLGPPVPTAAPNIESAMLVDDGGAIDSAGDFHGEAECEFTLRIDIE